MARTWRNDYQIWKWCRQDDFISDYAQMDWFRRQYSDPSIKMYKIMVSGQSKDLKISIFPVGVCGLTSIDMKNRRAEFSIYIAPAYHMMGLGKKAMRCLLTHGFYNLGLNLIWGEVFEENPALEMFRSLGFVDEGIRRDFYFRDAKFIPAHLISMRASEWTP